MPAADGLDEALVGRVHLHVVRARPGRACRRPGTRPRRGSDRMSCRPRATASDPTPSAVQRRGERDPEEIGSQRAPRPRRAPMTQVSALPMPAVDLSSGFERPKASIALTTTRRMATTPTSARATAASLWAASRPRALVGQRAEPRGDGDEEDGATPAGLGKDSATPSSVHFALAGLREGRPATGAARCGRTRRRAPKAKRSPWRPTRAGCDRAPRARPPRIGQGRGGGAGSTPGRERLILPG